MIKFVNERRDITFKVGKTSRIRGFLQVRNGYTTFYLQLIDF